MKENNKKLKYFIFLLNREKENLKKIYLIIKI